MDVDEEDGVDVDQEDGVDDVDQAVINKARHIQGSVVRDTRIRMQTSCLSHSATLSLTLSKNNHIYFSVSIGDWFQGPTPTSTPISGP